MALQACGTAVKEDPNDISNLPVRKECSLERLYKDMKGEIKADSPDMLFVNALCSGNPQSVVDLFREKKLFWDELPAVDTPYGRFEGLDAIREFAQGFIPKFKADRVVFTPIFQTIGGGRVALEGVFKFVVDGEVAGALGVLLIILFLHDTTESNGLPPVEVLVGEKTEKEY
ncbi:MAG: nuclear transport factor 2 family protein, partial [Bacteroidales bacterium]|nr:nuclear transport factor 2 family protein [Bacteroidales bacterium]